MKVLCHFLVRRARLLRSRLLLALPLLALPLFGGGGHAAEPSAAALCRLAQTLDQRISAATGLPPAAGCPTIGFALPTAEGLMRSQAGAYHPDSGRIDLAPDLDLGTVLGQSFLLHELVHAAQYRAGKHKSVPCPAALEAQAYTLQADFLQAHGLTRDALLTRMLAGQLGSCGTSAFDY